MVSTPANQPAVTNNLSASSANKEPLPVVQEINLNDETISPAFRNITGSPAEREAKILDFALKAAVQDVLRNSVRAIKAGEAVNGAALSAITPTTLQYANIEEHGALFGHALRSGESAEAHAKAYLVLDSLSFGRGYKNSDLSKFTEAIPLTTGVLATSLNLAQNSDQAIHLANSMIRGSLTTIASKLDDLPLREKFTRSDISERELVDVLKYADSKSRVKFIETALEASTSNVAVRGFIDGQLANALHYTTVAERVLIAKHCLSKAQAPSPEYGHVERLIRASKDFSELSQTVQSLGVDTLLKTHHEGLRDLAAKAVLLAELRKAELPKELGDKAPQRQTKAALLKIQEGLEARAHIILGHKEFEGTNTARILLDNVLSTAEGFKEQRAAAQDWPELKELANRTIVKIRLESTYGIKLSEEAPSFLSVGARWDIESLHEVEATFKGISEGVLLTTPLLNEVQRVNNLGDGVLGLRMPTGQIKIADFAVDNRSVALTYTNGVSSLQITLTHEIGHGVQLGRDAVPFYRTPYGIIVGPGESEHEFAVFMELSGWKLVDPSRWEFSNNGMSVKLDGVDHPVGYPIKHKGQEMVLVFDQGVLYTVDTYAPFVLNPYSRTNPWEDWAEGFAEYHLLPERLIAFAPEKFLYFEREFKKYENNSALIASAVSAAKPTSCSSQSSQPPAPPTDDNKAGPFMEFQYALPGRRKESLGGESPSI